MNMYDKAHELARAIRESSEVKELAALRARVEEIPESKRMLDDFRSRQDALQQRMMTGEMPPQEELEQMEKLYELVSLNPAVRQLFEAEQRLGVILEDVHRIISEPLGEIMK